MYSTYLKVNLFHPCIVKIFIAQNFYKSGGLVILAKILMAHTHTHALTRTHTHAHTQTHRTDRQTQTHTHKHTARTDRQTQTHTERVTLVLYMYLGHKIFPASVFLLSHLEYPRIQLNTYSVPSTQLMNCGRRV